jgi:hypothetical protein
VSPTDIHDRVTKVEQNQATLMAQMDEVRRQITILGTLPVGFAELANSVLNLKDDVKELTEALTDRDKQATDERRSVRTALLSLTGVIIAALIAAVAAIMVAKIGAPAA